MKEKIKKIKTRNYNCTNKENQNSILQLHISPNTKKTYLNDRDFIQMVCKDPSLLCKDSSLLHERYQASMGMVRASNAVKDSQGNLDREQNVKKLSSKERIASYLRFKIRSGDCIPGF